MRHRALRLLAAIFFSFVAVVPLDAQCYRYECVPDVQSTVACRLRGWERTDLPYSTNCDEIKLCGPLECHYMCRYFEMCYEV